MDAEAFAMEAFDERFVHCPHCQLPHGWATDDAYLEGADDPDEGAYPETSTRRCPFCFSSAVALTGAAIQATDGAPVKLGYTCQNARCRARFFLV